MPFTNKLAYVGGAGAQNSPIPCYRTIDGFGKDVEAAQVPHALSQDKALKMYKSMLMLQAMDTVFYDSQRQVSSCWNAR